VSYQKNKASYKVIVTFITNCTSSALIFIGKVNDFFVALCPKQHCSSGGWGGGLLAVRDETFAPIFVYFISAGSANL